MKYGDEQNIVKTIFEHTLEIINKSVITILD